MFKSARAIITLCLITGVSLSAPIGTVTGFFTRAWLWAQETWAGILVWINSPATIEQFWTLAGILLLPILLLAALFVITDR